MLGDHVLLVATVDGEVIVYVLEPSDEPDSCVLAVNRDVVPGPDALVEAGDVLWTLNASGDRVPRRFVLSDEDIEAWGLDHDQ